MKDRLAELLDRFDELIDDDPDAALALVESAPVDLARAPDVRAARADAVWSVHGASAALPLLEALAREQPENPDHHHALALAWEDQGDEQAKVREYLEVLRLDAARDADDAIDIEMYADVVVEAAERTLASLPRAFRDRLGDVAVLTEERPSRYIVEEGFDPRSLGLFEGPSAGDLGGASVSPAPTRIVLYVANLLSHTVDDDELEEEVRTTVLHEVGHFLGLDENELEQLGLG